MDGLRSKGFLWQGVIGGIMTTCKCSIYKLSRFEGLVQRFYHFWIEMDKYRMKAYALLDIQKLGAYIYHQLRVTPDQTLKYSSGQNTLCQTSSSFDKASYKYFAPCE